MGFRLNRTYLLQFEGAMEGAEVAIRGTSVGTMLKLRSMDDVTEIAAILAEHLIGWNFEDADGNPLPLTKEAILDNLEGVELGRIAAEWFKAAAGVTAPLDGPDSNSMESSLNMEPLTANV